MTPSLSIPIFFAFGGGRPKSLPCERVTFGKQQASDKHMRREPNGPCVSLEASLRGTSCLIECFERCLRGRIRRLRFRQSDFKGFLASFAALFPNMKGEKGGGRIHHIPANAYRMSEARCSIKDWTQWTSDTAILHPSNCPISDIYPCLSRVFAGVTIKDVKSSTRFHVHLFLLGYIHLPQQHYTQYGL